jgi:hypothetical protein
MWMGIVAGAVDLVVTVAVSKRTTPLPDSALVGLVKGLEDAAGSTPVTPVGTSPEVLGATAIGLALSMYLMFVFI